MKQLIDDFFKIANEGRAGEDILREQILLAKLRQSLSEKELTALLKTWYDLQNIKYEALS